MTKANFVINEIFPAPTYQKIEWIELYNNSNDTVCFNKGYIEDAKSSKELNGIIIPPKYYAILVKDTSSFLEIWEKSDSCVMIQVSLPILNNDEDLVVIRNQDSTVIDSIYYKFNSTKKGFSLEKINPNIFYDFENNWNYSESPDSSTPSKWNSISNKKIDVELNYYNDEHKIFFKIKSKNNLPAILENLKIYRDNNNDSKFESNEEIIHYNFNNQKLNDSLIVNFTINEVMENIKTLGDTYFKAILSAQNDKDIDNNSIVFYLTKEIPEQSIKFNEILFDTDDNMSDFIEIFNIGNRSISLNNLILSKYDNNALIDLTTFYYPSSIIKPKNYFVIASDSSIFNFFPELLGNEYLYIAKKSFNLSYNGDKLILKKPKNKIIDSIDYSRVWFGKNKAHTKNVSIEKFNPALESNDIYSWMSSNSSTGSTPLIENSIFREMEFDSTNVINIEPNPFTPYSSNNNFCFINYNLPYTNSIITANIYSQDGTIVRNLAHNENVSQNGYIIWNGRNDKGFLLDVGVYVIILQIKNRNHSNTYKKLIILAK